MTMRLHPRHGRVPRQVGVVLLAIALASLAIATPAAANSDVPIPIARSGDTTSATTGLDTTTGVQTEAESCDITPGVDNPTYNNVCPEWVSSFTSVGTDAFEGKLHVAGTTGDGWFTRATPNSKVFVTAGRYIEASYPAANMQMVLVATSADSGERLWSRHYATGVVPDAPGFTMSVPLAIDFSPDSRHVYIIGWTHTPQSVTSTPQLGFVLKVDAATGNTVWATTLGDVSVEETRFLWVPQDIKVGPHGDHVYVTGNFKDLRDCVAHLWCVGLSDEEAEPPWTAFTAALDTSSGDVLWLDEDRDHAPAYGWQLVLSPDGTRLFQVQPLLFAFNTVSGGPARAIRLVAYDPSSGEHVWDSQRFNYPPPPSGVDENRQNLPVGVAVSPDGSKVFVSTSHTYWRMLPGSADPVVEDVNFLALAWDATTGEQTWTRERGWADEAGCSMGLDSAAGAALSPSGGRLYVVGSINVDPKRQGERCDPADPGSGTIGLVALDTATGQDAWTKVYHNAGHAVSAPRFVAGGYVPTGNIVILAHNVHVKPGMGPGDEGSQVYVTAQATKNEDISFVNLAFDGLTGRQVWQTRYTRQDDITPQFQAGVLSPDGTKYLLTTAATVSALTPNRVDVEVTSIVYPTAGDPPAAALDATPVTGPAPLRVSFDASSSRATSSDAQVTRYRFDFGDGDQAIQTSPAATHTYSSPGTYTATVTIADSTGAVSTATVTIVVEPT